MAVDAVMEGRDSSLFVPGSSSGLSYQLHPVSTDPLKTYVLVGLVLRWPSAFSDGQFPMPLIK